MGERLVSCHVMSCAAMGYATRYFYSYRTASCGNMPAAARHCFSLHFTCFQAYRYLFDTRLTALFCDTGSVAAGGTHTLSLSWNCAVIESRALGFSILA